MSDLKADLKDAQIAALELVVDAQRRVMVDAVYGLSKARIWGGMDWHYNPLNPIFYRPVMKSLEGCVNAPLAQQPSAPSAEPAVHLPRGRRTRAEFVKLARVIAEGCARQADAPSYLPRTPEAAATFEPHGWVVLALMQAHADGYEDGHADGMAFVKAARPQQAAPQQTAPQAGAVGAPDPIGYMSPQQISLIADNCAEVGAYIPIRKTSAGNFTLGLYVTPEAAHAAPVPTVPPLTDAQIDRWMGMLVCSDGTTAFEPGVDVRPHLRRFARSVLAVRGEAAHQALTTAEIFRLMEGDDCWSHKGFGAEFVRLNFASAVMHACAAAWGITLAATPAPTPEE